MKKLTTLIILAWLTAFCGCALQEDMLTLRDRVILLEQENKELRQRDLEAKKELSSKIEDYGKTREEKERALRSQSAGLQAMFDEYREDLQAQRGKLEETEYLLRRKITALEQSEKQQNEKLGRLERMLRSGGGLPEPRPAPDDRPAVPPPESPAGRGTSATSPGDQTGNQFSENELYAMGKQALDQDKFDIAQKYFRQLLKQYPRSRRADNAQFWLGEIFYRQRWYEKAILEYQTVIEKYPNGNKIKASLLKQGFAFFNIGDKANARLILQELVDKFPDSHEASIARQKLSGF